MHILFQRSIHLLLSMIFTMPMTHLVYPHPPKKCFISIVFIMPEKLENIVMQSFQGKQRVLWVMWILSNHLIHSFTQPPTHGKMHLAICSIFHILPFLQVYWWQSLHLTSFHLYLYSTPSAWTQSSSRKLFGWLLAQAVKFPVPSSTQVKEPSVKMSLNPSQDFFPLWRCCNNTFSSLFWTSTRNAFSCRHLSRAVVQFWQVLLVK